MEVSSRISSDYSHQQVQQLLGVGRKRVCQWIENGWLQLREGRVMEASLEKFLRFHPEEYQLSRVDEAWFKGMVFPSFGQFNSARRFVGPTLEQKIAQVTAPRHAIFLDFV